MTNEEDVDVTEELYQEDDDAVIEAMKNLMMPEILDIDVLSVREIFQSLSEEDKKSLRLPQKSLSNIILLLKSTSYISGFFRKYFLNFIRLVLSDSHCRAYLDAVLSKRVVELPYIPKPIRKVLSDLLQSCIDLLRDTDAEITAEFLSDLRSLSYFYYVGQHLNVKPIVVYGSASEDQFFRDRPTMKGSVGYMQIRRSDESFSWRYDYLSAGSASNHSN